MRTGLRTRLMLAILAVSLAGLGHAAQQSTHETTEPRMAKEAQAEDGRDANATAPSSSSTHSRLLPVRRIVIDQETGQPRTPTAAESARMSSSAGATVRVRPLEQTQLPNGRGWRLNLEGRLVHALRATVADDGSVSVSHGPVATTAPPASASAEASAAEDDGATVDAEAGDHETVDHEAASGVNR